MFRHLLSLDDPAAADVAVSGSKAATLSRARAMGSPVLPGWVVPVKASSPAVAVGADGIRRGAPEACLAISALALEGGLVDELARVPSEHVESSIVRSSSVQEGDRRWAGGFATYHDIPAAGVADAIRACWASAFTREAVRRREELGERSGDVRIAVLIQPWLAFALGGVATRTEGGGVRISWVRGGPAGLVSGRRTGAVIEIDEQGRPTTEPPDSLASHLGEVVSLVREVADAGLGDSIEWGSRGTEVVLLQVDRSERSTELHRPRHPEPTNLEVGGSPIAGRIAVAASLFPGSLGEDVVLPWAAAPGADLSATPCRLGDPADALLEALMLGTRLTREAWGGGRNMIAGEVAATFRALLGPAPEAAIDRLSRLRPVDPALGHRAVSLLTAIAGHLVEEGRLQGEHEIWRLSPAVCMKAIEGSAVAPIPLGPTRWEPFLFDVVRTNGTTTRGTPISPAIGAGWRFVPEVHQVERGAPRRVLVLRDPVPQAAPLLWGSAGLVTANGSLGAHLFEVARSLGVPAVAGVDLGHLPEQSMVAVDGHAGDVTVWVTADANATMAPLSA
jgi:phosphohistidine swiveling domain-containing protein